MSTVNNNPKAPINCPFLRAVNAVKQRYALAARKVDWTIQSYFIKRNAMRKDPSEYCRLEQCMRGYEVFDPDRFNQCLREVSADLDDRRWDGPPC